MTASGRAASRASRVGAAVVASGAAALSFRGTADFAENSHAVDPGWGWIVPLVVEAGVLTAAAIAWVRSGDGVTARLETTVMACLLTLSVVINMAHASNTTFLGHVVAAAPPLVLLVAVEGLLREQRRMAGRQSTMRNSLAPAVAMVDQSVAMQPDVAVTDAAVTDVGLAGLTAGLLAPSASVSIAAHSSPIAGPATSAGTATSNRQPAELPDGLDMDDGAPSLRERVLNALEANQSVTGAVVGNWLDVSESTGLRRLRELRIADAEVDAMIRGVNDRQSVSAG